MFFHQRFVPGLAIYSYLVGDEKSKEAALVDPTRDVDELLDLARREGLHVKHVLETHVHADFVSGAREVKDRLGEEVQIHSSAMGGPEWTPTYADHAVQDGDVVQVGALRIQAVHTPGHTPEHLMWALYDTTRSADVPWLLFTGDFLFVGDVGRPDLLGEEQRKVLAHQLYDSVFEKLPPLAEFTEVFPSHGSGSLCGKAIGSRASSTVGFERRFNASLIVKPEEQWVTDLMREMPPAPPYFARMKRINREGPAVLGRTLPGQQPLTPLQVQKQMSDDTLFLDVRSKEAFAAAHIPGSVNIPFAANLSTWAGWVLPYDRPILLVADDARQVPAVVTQLIRVGIDDVRGYLEGGIDAWETAGYPLDQIETISAQDLHDRLADRGAHPMILDVRTEGEYASGHIEGAVHIHAGQLEGRLDEVPRDRQVVVICGSGYRGSIAASLLARAGVTPLSNVAGGMTAWKAQSLPVVKGKAGREMAAATGA